ncbi:MAG TPA: cytochrome C oxidase subunit IV family protein [Candidatus Polarisedimenticolaceae bacterium]|nr:cytochrome C oxidase subunit IV family protein [Candidatus Polarisedimenticolaceae bacterium]
MSQSLGHVTSVRLLVGVLSALLALTVLTVAVSGRDFGAFNLPVALGIALIKGSLVLLYFMHLRWDRPFNAIVVLASLALLVLFIVLTLLDAHQYLPDEIPGYAPQLPAAAGS